MSRCSSAQKKKDYSNKITQILEIKNNNPKDISNSTRKMLGSSINLQPISHKKYNQSTFTSKQKFFQNSQIFTKSRVYDLNQLVNSVALTIKDNKEDSVNTFLKILYSKKAEDLKLFKNTKHEKNFIDKLKGKVTQEILYVLDCQLGIQSIKHICQYLNQSSITKINLSSNPLGDQGIKILSQTIIGLQLTELILISVNISPKGSKILMDSLSKCKTLQILNISSFQGLNRNRFGKQSLTQLGEFLSDENCVIKQLIIQNSSIGAQGFGNICQINNSSKLQFLNVSGNQIKDMKPFLQKFRFISLKKLYIANNLIGDDGMQVLATLIGTEHNRNIIAQHLKYIDVSNNKIKSYGIQTFSRQMSNNQVLQELILDNNPLNQGDRFYNIKYLLTRSWSLKKLSLKATIRSPQDFRSLKDGLQQNRSIQTLNISNNSMQSESFQYVIQMLAENKSIKTLLAQNCNISDKFVAKIQLLKANKVMTTLSLQNNFLHDKGAYAFIALLKINSNISSLNLMKNCISLNVLKEIDHLLKQNKNVQSISQPDMSYYGYVEQIQNSHRSVLLTNIEKLQERQQKQHLHSLICQIALGQKQINEVKISINEQKKKITNFQNALKQKNANCVSNNMITTPENQA